MPQQHRSLRLLAVLLAVGLVLAGCGGGEDDDNETGAGVGASTSTSGLFNADGTPAGPPPGGEGTDGPGSGSGSGGSGDNGGAPGADRTDIPLAGRYTYDYVANGGGTKERTLDVHDGGPRRGDVRQGLYFGAGSTVLASYVVWLGTDSYYTELEQRAQGSQQGARCVWNPGFVELDLPLATGKTWKSDSTCSSDASSRRRTMQAKVTGTETITIGGTPVKVWVVQRTVDTHTEAKGTNVSVVTDEKRVTTDRFSVDRHLLVRSDGTESTTLNGAPRGTVQFTLTMRSLTPGPIPSS